MFFDKFSKRPGMIASRRIVCSRLLDSTTWITSELFLLLNSFCILLLTKLEFSASVYPKPIIIKLTESKTFVMLFFCPTEIEVGREGFRFSIPYPNTTSSTKSIGPKMANLNRGIIQDILVALATASILHFLKEFAIIDEDRFKPKMLFTSSADRIIFLHQ